MAEIILLVELNLIITKQIAYLLCNCKNWTLLKLCDVTTAQWYSPAHGLNAVWRMKAVFVSYYAAIYITL